ncbi:hypothetical protein G6F23_012656 [Rhizopus arrhizus]|nr:hypothetical protein G6F23_012656 [Rhizopus arrhizus]
MLPQTGRQQQQGRHHGDRAEDEERAVGGGFNDIAGNATDELAGQVGQRDQQRVLGGAQRSIGVRAIVDVVDHMPLPAQRGAQAGGNVRQATAERAVLDEQQLAVLAVLDAAVDRDHAVAMEAADVRHRGVADHDALQLQAVQYRLHARRVETPVEIAAVPDRAGLAVIQRRGGGVGLHFGLGQAQRGLVRRVGARRIERQCHRLGRDAAVQEQGVTDLQQHRAAAGSCGRAAARCAGTSG